MDATTACQSGHNTNPKSDFFIDPHTKEPFLNPRQTREGHTLEEKTIEECGHHNPYTGEKLEENDTRPDLFMKRLMKINTLPVVKVAFKLFNGLLIKLLDVCDNSAMNELQHPSYYEEVDKQYPYVNWTETHDVRWFTPNETDSLLSPDRVRAFVSLVLFLSLIATSQW
jgi:hypothetical protein